MTGHGGNQPVTVGPHELPGYRTFEFTWRGERTPQFEAIFTTFGLHPVRHTGPAFAYLTVIRFDALLALQMTTRPATYAWIRDCPEARRRYGFLLASQGSVSLTANGVTSTATEGGILAAAPSAGDVTFEAHTEATFVFVSFDANEVRPFSMSGTGTTTVELPKPVFRAVHDYLAEATKSPPSTSPRESEVLRSLTRNVALSLVRAAAPAGQHGGLVERASAVIEANAPSASFTANDVARELGVVRRTLDRAYAREGLSISDKLRLQRARRARQLLIRHPSLSLRDIAEQSGFSSPQVMRRALDRYYEAAPAAIVAATKCEHLEHPSRRHSGWRRTHRRQPSRRQASWAHVNWTKSNWTQANWTQGKPRQQAGNS